MELASRQWPCSHCGVLFSKSFNLKRHIKTKHNRVKIEAMDDLDKPSTSSSIELLSIPVSKKYVCDICGHIFSKNFNYKRHYITRHLNPKPPRNRPKATPNSVIKAKKVQKSFYCPVCNEKKSTRFNLRRHMNQVHPNHNQPQKDGNLKSVYCQKCHNYSCSRLIQLAIHVRDFHEKPFIKIHKRIEGTQNFNILIDELKKRFNGSLATRSFKSAKAGHEYFIFKCDHSIDIVNSAKDVVKAPCTFHLNIAKKGSIYHIDGCYSHLGHKIEDEIPFDQLLENDINLFECIDEDTPQFNNKNDLLLDHIEKSIKTQKLYGETSESVGSTKMPVDEAYLRKLMTLEKLASNVYRANYLKSPTGRRTGNAYGGLLFAQSLKAAQMTLDSKKYLPHAMHTLFVLSADSTKTAEFKVETVRDGRSFITRTVNAEQDSKTVMTTQLSFCVKEDTSIQHQAEMPNVPKPDQIIKVVDFCKENLDKFEKGEIELSSNTVVYYKHAIAAASDNFFEARCSNPEKYFGLVKMTKVEPFYFWFRTTCKLSDDLDEHQFLLAYLTDLVLASAANRPHLGLGYSPSMVLSLDHSVRFHSFDYRVDDWILYEVYSPWAEHGRAFSEGRLWTKDGKLIASTSQESLSRTRGKKSCL